MTPILGVIDSSKLKSSGAFDSIATATLSASTSTTFSSIPSSYKHLQLRFNVECAGSNVGMYVSFNGVTSGYAWHMIDGIPASPTARNFTGQTSIIVSSYGRASVTTYPNVGIVDIIDYASTTKNKTVRAYFGAQDNNTAASSISLNSGLYPSTTAISSLTFSAGGALTGTVSLYGIKG